MSDTVIRVENLSKKYIIGHQKQERYVSLRDVMADKVKSFGGLFSRNGKAEDLTHEDFWALKDVSFEIKQGDRVGIIGRNGAGKSTLLKILSRIAEPTSGRISIKGRVASLLEVGTGFHPELTGRENVYLNGAILGMDRWEIKKKFDEIVAFAEVEKFLDTPVKRYSSGMYVRLAFAVAAHLEPEILIVDEVLAVGDTAFQKKCLGKMEDVGKEGRTVLFVSHNLSAIQRLCTTGIYLKSGELRVFRDISKVIETYHQDSLSHSGQERQDLLKEGEVKFVQWVLSKTTAKSKHSCYSRDECKMLFKLISKRKIKNAFVGFALWDSRGDLILAGTSKDQEGGCIYLNEGVHTIEINTKLALKGGSYQIDISLNDLEDGLLDIWNATPQLMVVSMLENNLPEKWQGILNEEIKFNFCI